MSAVYSILGYMEKDDNPLKDEKIRASLYAMNKKDPDGFMDEVLISLKRFPEFIVEDGAPLQQKIASLTRMMKHYEKTEQFENCLFVKTQIDKLNGKA